MTSALLSLGGAACRRAESAFLACIEENNMTPLLTRGVTLALSAGADSTLLFHLLRAYTEQNRIPFAALHVHHGIRGEEADRDADFARALCAREGIPFFLLRVDVPAYLAGNGHGKSREEAARVLRYGAIETFLSENPTYGVCATAHHATDNLETVLFQMLRGSGLAGVAGIPPVRDRILRPLLYLAKRDILAALDELGEGYMMDTTNSDLSLDRNYLREEILPRLTRLRPDPEAAVTRLSANLREELALRESALDDFFVRYVKDGCADRRALVSLPSPLRTRAVLRLYREAGGRGMPTQCQLRALFAREDGSRRTRRHDLSGGMRVIFEGDRVFLLPRGEDTPRPRQSYDLPLSLGCNKIGENGEAELWLFSSRNVEFERANRNIYNLFIQASLASATMKGTLSARSRRAGDAYRTGGMTRSVRRLLSSAHHPAALRELLPVVTDARGILWVPGFGVRDAEKEQKKAELYAYFCYGRKN